MGEHVGQRRRRRRRRAGRVRSDRDLCRRLRSSALPRRLVSRSESEARGPGTVVVQLPHPAAHAVLLFVRVGRRRFRPRRQHGHRLRSLHLPGTGFHEGPRVLHGALHEPLDELLVQLARVRRRLHRRRLARRAAGVNFGYPVVRESERRAEALGFGRRHRAAGAQRLGSVGDEGHRCRRQARSRVCERRRDAMGEARSGQPDRTVALDAGWRGGHVRGAWHRRRRHQRRRPRRHPQRLRMVGTAREGDDRDVAVPSCRPSAVRTAAGPPAAPRCACTTSTATNSTMS